MQIITACRSEWLVGPNAMQILMPYRSHWHTDPNSMQVVTTCRSYIYNGMQVLITGRSCWYAGLNSQVVLLLMICLLSLFQASILFDTVQAGMGDASKGKYTGACFERWGCLALRSLSGSFIDSLPEDDHLLEIADTLAHKDAHYMDVCMLEASAVGCIMSLLWNIRC